MVAELRTLGADQLLNTGDATWYQRLIAERSEPVDLAIGQDRLRPDPTAEPPVAGR